MTTDIHRDGDFLEVFQEVTRLISMVHDPQQVMDLVVERLPELLEVDAATIRLLDSGTNTFVLGAACGVSDEYLSRTTIDSKEVMAALMQGQPTARTDIDVALRPRQLRLYLPGGGKKCHVPAYPVQGSR